MPSDNRSLVPLAATTLLLGVLLLWARTYQQSCLALASPGFIYVAVFWGLLQYRLERRRFAIEYYLDDGSPWRRRLRRSWLPAAISLVAAVPLTVLLAGFVALARASDWLFLIGAAVLAPLLFDRLSVWPGRHLRGAGGQGTFAAPAGILTSRLAGHLLLVLVVIAYVYANYSMILPPPNIHPGFPEFTITAFSPQARSACPLVETGLSVAASFKGLAWWFMAVAESGQEVSPGLMMFGWAAFFLNAALTMTGFVRGLEGANLAARHMASRRESSREREGGAAKKPERWAALARWTTIVVGPLAVLAAIGHHALQQQAEEQLEAQLRSVDMPETRRAIDERVETAFAPVYAAIPGLVDRYYSPAMLLDAVSLIIGEDKTLVAELRRMVSGARQEAVAGFDRELLEEGVAQLGHLFSRSVEALPPLQRGLYELVLAPVFERAKSRLEDAVTESEEDILKEIERAAETTDIATRFSGVLRWMVSSDSDRQALRGELAFIVDWHKERTKADLLRAVEAFKSTPLGDVPPARFRSASQ